jgi:hypothetical protein
MKRPLITIVLLGAAALAASHQTAPVPPATAAAAASAASTPAPTKPARRPLTGEEQRDLAQFPDGSQPERPAKPQVVVPFGKKPPPDTTADAAAQGAAAAPGKVNDQVARCKALAGPQRQAACVHAPVASDASPSPSGSGSGR